MRMSEKNHQLEANPYEGSPAPQNQRTRRMGHGKRWWCLGLLIFLVIAVLVIVLPILYVAVPHYAQKQLDQSILELRSQLISNPTPNSVDLDIITATLSNSSHHSSIDAFQADLFLENTLPNYKPFGRITIPAAHTEKETLTTINQTMQILDMDQFVNYCKLILGSETYRLALRGKVNLHDGSLPTCHLNFNKVITANGLNSLAGFHLSDFNVSLTPAADGSNLNGHALIPNPSLLSVDLGEVQVDFFVDNVAIGNGTLASVFLKPGNNTVPIKAVANTTAILPLIMAKYQNGTLPVEVRGKSVSKNGVVLPYYTEALQASPFYLPLDLGPALQSIGIPLGSLTGGSSTSAAVPAATATRA